MTDHSARTSISDLQVILHSLLNHKIEEIRPVKHLMYIPHLGPAFTKPSHVGENQVS